MKLKSKLSLAWDVVKYVIENVFLLSPKAKYYKELLDVNRKTNPYFNKFLSLYNYISNIALLLSVMFLLTDLVEENFIIAIVQVLITWMLYVAKVKGLFYLAMFFSCIKEDNSHLKEPKEF